MTTWWSAHTHSHYSALDAIASVPELVRQAARYEYPALALTDHGNLAGTVDLYKSCREHGILPFPGVEAYVLVPSGELDGEPYRVHLGVLALDLEGYKALVRLVSLSHTRPRFSRFPRLYLKDVMEFGTNYGTHVAVTTGCFFGLALQVNQRYGYQAARKVVSELARRFPHTFVEVQNHKIDHDGVKDSVLVGQMMGLAHGLGLPVIATQDSHYLRTKDREAHALMKRMVYGGAEDEFPGDSFHLASPDWIKEHYSTKQWRRISEGQDHLLALHNMHIPHLDAYKTRAPEFPDAMKQLTAVCLAKVEMKPQYTKRLKRELDVIRKLGMASYFLLVADYVAWCIDRKIMIEARGSANGSLVCYLLGITQVDPLRYRLSFDRFLSEDRIKPPDIDLDVDFHHHGEVMDYISRRWKTARIGTWMNLGTNAEGKGSVLVTYNSWRRRKGDAPVGSIEQVRNPRDREGLERLAAHEVYRSYGAHPGGLVVLAEPGIEDLIPTMLIASSDTPVTQFDGDAVEEFGCLKLDVLGQRTLAVMKRCQELMGRSNPADLTWIPGNDPKTFQSLRTGQTNNGIFHFEGYTKAKGGKEMGIRSMTDVILAQALYMPGALDTGQKDVYIRHRRDPALWKGTGIHPIYDEVLKPTLGAVVFQEQVLEIMRKLGMSMAGINQVFKLVKKLTPESQERMAVIRTEFDSLCDAKGITRKDDAWEMTAGFARYGFNKCTVGDTVVTRSNGNQHGPRETTVASLYTAWNSQTAVGKKYRRQGLMILAHKNGRIKQDRVIGVYQQGVKPVYKVTLENGMSITTTDNHRHLTRDGWKQVRDIQLGDELATMGEYEHYCTPTGGVPYLHNGRRAAYEEVKGRAGGACEWCGYTQGRLEIAHLNHNRQDNDPVVNLRLLCNHCHKQHDWDTGRRVRRHAKGRPVVWSPVRSVVYVGRKMTYDLEMEGKDHSWVGNGIVTHNSHATGYGVRSYRCAYLKTHYPKEFMTALLETWAGVPDKEKLYVREARRIEVRILPVDVRLSQASWSMEKAGIRRGLLSVSGIGHKAAQAIEAAQPFDTVKQMCERVDSRAVTGSKGYREHGAFVGNLKTLRDIGALNSCDDYDER